MQSHQANGTYRGPSCDGNWSGSISLVEDPGIFADLTFEGFWGWWDIFAFRIRFMKGTKAFKMAIRCVGVLQIIYKNDWVMNELGLTKHMSYETNLYQIPAHYTGWLIGNPKMKLQNRIQLEQAGLYRCSHGDPLLNCDMFKSTSWKALQHNKVLWNLGDMGSWVTSHHSKWFHLSGLKLTCLSWTFAICSCIWDVFA